MAQPVDDELSEFIKSGSFMQPQPPTFFMPGFYQPFGQFYDPTFVPPDFLHHQQQQHLMQQQAALMHQQPLQTTGPATGDLDQLAPFDTSPEQLLMLMQMQVRAMEEQNQQLSAQLAALPGGQPVAAGPADPIAILPVVAPPAPAMDVMDVMEKALQEQLSHASTAPVPKNGSTEEQPAAPAPSSWAAIARQEDSAAKSDSKPAAATPATPAAAAATTTTTTTTAALVVAGTAAKNEAPKKNESSAKRGSSGAAANTATVTATVPATAAAAVAAAAAAPAAAAKTGVKAPGGKGASSASAAASSVPAHVLPLLVHTDEKLYNPTNFNTKPAQARFFIIKSYSEDDVHKSIKHNVWTSTKNGNQKLDAAYAEARARGMPLYLFFSVNASGHFCGMAQMTSAVDFNKDSGLWAQDKWKSEFCVKWIFVKDVPNKAFKNITNPINDNKPVSISRDTQEVPIEQGRQMLQLIATHALTTSLFDDFAHYEERTAAIQAAKLKEKQQLQQAADQAHAAAAATAAPQQKKHTKKPNQKQQ